MDKMELVVIKLAKDLSYKWQFTEDERFALEKDLKSFFQSDPDARWALREYREKQAKRLKDISYTNIDYHKICKDIDKYFELMDKEEKINRPPCPNCGKEYCLCVAQSKLKEEIKLPEKWNETDFSLVAGSWLKIIMMKQNNIISYLEQKGV